MGHQSKMIVNGARRMLVVAEALLKGVTAEQASRKPRFVTASGATVVDTNHPMWVYGHLALYPVNVLRAAGLSVEGAEVPAAWTDLFKNGSPCVDDVAGTLYPAFDAVTSLYLSATKVCLDRFEGLSDDAMNQPHPDERYRERFGTIGGVSMFMLNNHVSLHLGQVSAWRRCFGLPSAL